MTTKIRLFLAAAVVAASLGSASAQPAQHPMMQGPNHPGPMPMRPGDRVGGPGMPVGGVHAMHGGMSSMGMGPAGMHGFGHVEGRLAFAKAEMKITDAQTPQWNAFAEVIRSSSASQRTAMQGMMQASGGTAPEQIERRIALATAHLEAMKTVLTAAKPLYAVLTDEQKKVADELMSEHMMGMRAR